MKYFTDQLSLIIFKTWIIKDKKIKEFGDIALL